MCFIWIQGVQGRGSTFNFRHALVKKAILEGKRATVPSDLLLAVKGAVVGRLYKVHFLIKINAILTKVAMFYHHFTEPTFRHR